MIRGLVLGIAIAVLIASCIVHPLLGPRITGTCDGACDHYIACKPGHSDTDKKRCKNECPDVFGDRDSLMAFESLSCPNAVEYIDGGTTRAATVNP